MIFQTKRKMDRDTIMLSADFEEGCVGVLWRVILVLFCCSYSTLFDCTYPYRYPYSWLLFCDSVFVAAFCIPVFCYIRLINTWHSSQVCLAFLFLQTWRSSYKYVTFVMFLCFPWFPVLFCNWPNMIFVTKTSEHIFCYIHPI